MGEVIRKDAAAEDIFADLYTTILAARSHKGVFAEYAEMKLEPVVAMIEPLETERTVALAEATPLLAALDAEDHAADATVSKVADDIWNAVGRPASDAAYDVLFPSGSVFYVRGDVSEQPSRMLLLARLLRAGVHPRLDVATAKRAAEEIETAAAKLKKAVDAARDPRVRVELVQRTRTAVARTAAIELASYKRMLKAQGVSEAKIHEVLPDRPRSRRASSVAVAEAEQA